SLERAQHLDPGPVRRRTAVLPGCAPRDSRTPAARLPCERGRERGLADARLAGDEHQAPAAAAGSISQGRPARGPFGVPANTAMPGDARVRASPAHRCPPTRAGSPRTMLIRPPFSPCEHLVPPACTP